MNPIDADSAALAGAGSVAEEALALHRDALAVLTEGWQSQSGCAATDLLRRQCGDAAEVVAALYGAAIEMGSLRDTLAQNGTGGMDPASAQDGFARAAARLSDRPATGFDASAPPSAYAVGAPPAPQPAPAWSPTPIPVPLPTPGGALPGIGGAMGGALVALVARLADGLGRDAAGAGEPDGPPGAAVETPPHPAVRPHGEAVTIPSAAAPIPSPVPRPGVPEAAPAQADAPVPQTPAPEPPLLAAERPPAVEPGGAQSSAEPGGAQSSAEPAGAQQPAQDDRNPCEIAADELPHAG